MSFQRITKKKKKKRSINIWLRRYDNDEDPGIAPTEFIEPTVPINRLPDVVHVPNHDDQFKILLDINIQNMDDFMQYNPPFVIIKKNLDNNDLYIRAFNITNDNVENEYGTIPTIFNPPRWNRGNYERPWIKWCSLFPYSNNNIVRIINTEYDAEETVHPIVQDYNMMINNLNNTIELQQILLPMNLEYHIYTPNLIPMFNYLNYNPFPSEEIIKTEEDIEKMKDDIINTRNDLLEDDEINRFKKENDFNFNDFSKFYNPNKIYKKKKKKKIIYDDYSDFFNSFFNNDNNHENIEEEENTSFSFTKPIKKKKKKKKNKDNFIFSFNNDNNNNNDDDNNDFEELDL
jgi:hypothetical protein